MTRCDALTLDAPDEASLLAGTRRDACAGAANSKMCTFGAAGADEDADADAVAEALEVAPVDKSAATLASAWPVPLGESAPTADTVSVPEAAADDDDDVAVVAVPWRRFNSSRAARASLTRNC